MRWQVKCLIDNCKGLFPFQNAWRRFKRRVTPYRTSLERAAFAIDEGTVQIQWLREALGTLAGKSILEVGSGWELLLPMQFSLCGAERVYLTDLTALVDSATLAGGLQCLRHYRDRFLPKLGVDAAEFERQFGGDVGSPEEFLRRHRLVYLAPCDCRHLTLADASLDAVTSRSVLEHIPREVIVDIVRESHRLLKPGGVMCHFIDNSDHWQHVDRSISRVNFLRYSDRVFRLTYLNELNYHNRLRHSEYRTILEDGGFEIVREKAWVDPAMLEVLKTLPLAPRFRGFSKEDLATTDSYLLARKKSR